MPTFRLREPHLIEAHQWFKNGDHPGDKSVPIDPEHPEQGCTEGRVVRRYRHPNVSGNDKCPLCGNLYHVHGWLDLPDSEGLRVCPGDWGMYPDTAVFRSGAIVPWARHRRDGDPFSSGAVAPPTRPARPDREPVG